MKIILFIGKIKRKHRKKEDFMDGSILGQVLASAVKYVQENCEEEINFYFDEIPENFLVPALYFPVPQVISKKVTLASYASTLFLEVWFFAKDEWKAYSYARNVQENLLQAECMLPIVKKDGTKEEWSIRITEPEVQKIDQRTIQLSFALKNYFSFAAEEGKAKNILWEGFLRQEEISKVWEEATRQQRKKEEVQKKCLQRAMTTLTNL